MNQHAPEAPATARNRAKVFISYSRQDMAFAQMLVGALATRGFDAFLDKTDIAPGEPWKDRLAALIAAADTVIFAISPDSVSSSICSWELEESVRLGKRIIPVVTRRVADADASPLLGSLNWVFLAETDDRELALSALDTALRTDLAWVREHTRLGELARRWDEQNRNKAATLRGTELDAAERWLDRRPADANAPTHLHQDFIRASRQASTERQRRWIAGSIVAAVTFALVALGAVFEWRTANEQRAAAEAARSQAEQARGRAEQATQRADRNFSAAKQTVDGLIFNIAQGLRGLDGIRVETIRTILDTVQKSVAQLVETAPDDPNLLHSRGAMFTNFVKTYLAAGDYKDAVAAANQGIDNDRKLAALDLNEDQAAGAQRDLSVSLSHLGDVKKQGGDRAGALAAHQESLDISRKLVAQHPHNRTNWSDVAEALGVLGDMKVEDNDAAGALVKYQESLGILHKLTTEDPDDAEALSNEAICMIKIGDAKWLAQDMTAALAAYQQSLDINRRLASQRSDYTLAQRNVAMSLEKISDIKRAGGDRVGALAAAQESLDTARKLAERDPGNAQAQRDLSVTFGKLGDVKLQGGDKTGALAAYQASLDIRRRLAARAEGDVQAQIDIAVSLINVAHASRNPAPIYREALALTQQIDAAGKLPEVYKQWILQQVPNSGR